MADFDSWDKHSLVQFAQQSQQALTAKDEIIAELTAQVKAVHLAWRLSLAQPVPSATLGDLKEGEKPCAIT